MVRKLRGTHFALTCRSENTTQRRTPLQTSFAPDDGAPALKSGPCARSEQSDACAVLQGLLLRTRGALSQGNDRDQHDDALAW